MVRKERQCFPDDRSAAKFTIETGLEIWGTNSTLVDLKATLEVTSFDLNSEWKDTWSQEVVLAPNSSTELWQGNVAGQPIRTKKSELPKIIVVSARLLRENGVVIGRHSNW